MKVAATIAPVRVLADEVELEGTLTVPENARTLVLFAHGSGSSRLSPRNLQVAEYLNDHGHATLLFDLLTPQEEEEDRATHEMRTDIHLLANRLSEVTAWAKRQEDLRHLTLAYFGANTGAAAALVAATDHPGRVHGVVCRGGRTDLAHDMLPRVPCPVLLVVGGEDKEMLDLNEDATHLIEGPVDVHVVHRATHLFEEPGALEEVARIASRWLDKRVATE